MEPPRAAKRGSVIRGRAAQGGRVSTPYPTLLRLSRSDEGPVRRLVACPPTSTRDMRLFADWLEGWRRLHPAERAPQRTRVTAALRRLEEALAWRTEDGTRLAERGPLVRLPLEAVSQIQTCGAWRTGDPREPAVLLRRRSRGVGRPADGDTANFGLIPTEPAQ